MIITATDIGQTLHALLNDTGADRVFMLCDENTLQKCIPLLLDHQPSAISHQPFPVITIPAGDDNKNLGTLETVWHALTEGGATRHSLLLNVGGGVVTDIGGFAAATFKRGIRYINIPTTLLAMVDAATGGKTGINFAGLKNEIGAFHQPEHVILYSGFLTTLDKENLLSGMAEMFKHILIGHDDNAVTQMDTLADTFASFQMSGSNAAEVSSLIRQSVGIKEQIVTTDPTEKDVRKALNFGHTLGHAIESLLLERHTPVLHGFAVAWGMIGELYLSHILQTTSLPLDTLRGATRLLNELYGPCPISCKDYERLYSLMLHDKKNRRGCENKDELCSPSETIRFVLLAAPGDVRLDCTASCEEIFEALDFLRER